MLNLLDILVKLLINDFYCYFFKLVKYKFCKDCNILILFCYFKCFDIVKF